ncbi:hypothetical protein DPSP01_002418 [Paraphaeosphaeria sporulosa]
MGQALCFRRGTTLSATQKGNHSTQYANNGWGNALPHGRVHISTVQAGNNAFQVANNTTQEEEAKALKLHAKHFIGRRTSIIR